MTNTEKPKTQLRGPLIAGAIVFVLFFGGLGTWATTAPMDSAVMAQGEIIAEGSRRPVQHLDGGTVAKLLVSGGEKVEEDELLVRLDDTQLRSQVESLQNRVDNLRAEKARLEAELANKDELSFPGPLMSRQGNPDVKAIVEGERRLFEARQRSLASELRRLRLQVSDSDGQLEALEAQKAAYSERVTLLEEERESFTDLEGEGYASSQELRQVRRQLASARARLAAVRGQISEARKQRNQAEAQIERLKNKRDEQNADRLRSVQKELGRLVPHLTAQKRKLARTEIRAPIAGYVLEPTVSGPGSVLKPGQKAMDIVPASETMEVEARVMPTDIESLHAGMAAQVRLTSFSRRTMPAFDGEIVSISPDRIKDPQTGRPYYATKVIIRQDELKQMGVELKPGMPARVTIPIEGRTALDYLIGPIVDSAHKAFREQ